MLLDYNERKETFVLFVERGEADPQTFVQDHGLDFSITDSTNNRAVLFTKEPYAVCAFAEHATPLAHMQLAPLLEPIERSWAQAGTRVQAQSRDGKVLAPYQSAGVEYGLDKAAFLIGDQPGLGKTAQAIVYANEIRAKRVLVICPANIREQWCNEIRNWSTMEDRYVVYPIFQSRDGVHPRAQWTVVSYDLARTPAIMAALLKGRYDLCVLDEAHYLKSSDAARTRGIFGGDDRIGLTSVCERVLGLTGTPLPNRPRECFTLARHLDWGSIDWLSERKFMHRFNPSMRDVTKEGKMYVREETGRLAELQARLRANWMVRRMKKDVLTQLPQVRHQITHIHPDGEIRKALEAEKHLDIDPTDFKGLNAEVLGHISVVRHQMGMALAPHVADHIEMLIDGGEEKLFVVGWHIAVLDLLEQRLGRYGLVRIDGSTSPTRRGMLIKQFQDDPACRIALGNILAVGIGTDGLQKVCGRMVAAECDWTPGNNQQVVDRLHRMGQQQSVLAEWMVAPGSFAERILGRSIEKLKDIDKALDKQVW